jgi:hypothetical protein
MEPATHFDDHHKQNTIKVQVMSLKLTLSSEAARLMNILYSSGR